MIQKIAETSVPINELIAERWSPRAFDITKEVDRKDIISICEAARWAPSCINEQPWRFMIWDIFKDKDSYMRALHCLSETNQKWVSTAPVMIASFANFVFQEDQSENRWGAHDTGLATQNLLLQAFSLGLVAHPLGGFEVDILRKEFNIPDDFLPMAFIALGYQREPEGVLSDYNIKRENAPRARRPLEETFFDSAWGVGIV